MLYIDFTSTEEQSSNDSKDQNYSFFHSTIIFSTKNSPSSSSGISEDSRSRYWWLWANHHVFNQTLDTFSRNFSLVFLYNLFLHTNCHKPEPSDDISLMLIFLSSEKKSSGVIIIALFTTSILVVSSPNGFRPLRIRELRRFSSSFILDYH